MTLLCHAATRAMRVGAFPTREEGLDAGGLKKAGARRLEASVWLTSPALAAQQTAEALGVSAMVDESLRDIDHGSWAGLTFEQVQAADPAGLSAWLADPARGAPGGEGLAEVRARLADWLESQAQGSSPVIAITHPMVIRAAIAEALDMPSAAALRIDIAPLSAAMMSFNLAWRLRAIGPYDQGTL
ncbi:histidine phosphatase family protein [Caulobacter sp. 3R27C2-B]|nr:histidine phosphatase family protein [Caulobacter sp. 3R27C2-B]